MWKFPYGEKLYSYLIKFNTTTSLSPQQIHELGLSEVKRLQEKAISILKKEGYSVDYFNFGQSLNSIWKDKKFQFSDDESGRKEIIQEYTRVVAFLCILTS